MSYEEGDKVCLWKTEDMVTVTEELMVTVTAIGEGNNVYARDEDNLEYRFSGRNWQRSGRLAEGEVRVNFLNSLFVYNTAKATKGGPVTIVDEHGNAMLPNGDNQHCEEHDHFYPDREKCFVCKTTPAKQIEKAA